MISLIYDCQVFDNAKVCNESRLIHNAKIYGHAYLKEGCAMHNAEIYDNARIIGWSEVYGNAKVYEDAIVEPGIRICNNVRI